MIFQSSFHVDQERFDPFSRVEHLKRPKGDVKGRGAFFRLNKAG